MKYFSENISLTLNQEKCNGCKMCTMVCPHNVFEVKKGKAQIIKKEKCMECGACAMNCQQAALFVKSGVGCAAGIINGILNNTEPSCGCSTNTKSCC